MKPVAESSKAADTERFEREVGVWHPPKKTGGAATHRPSNPTASTKGVSKMKSSTLSRNVNSGDIVSITLKTEQITFTSNREKACAFIDSLPEDTIKKIGHLTGVALSPEAMLLGMTHTRVEWKKDIQKATTLICAEIDDKVVGLVSAIRVGNDVKTVYELATISTVSGCGTRLMEEYRRRFPNSLTKACVETENIPAMKLALKYCDIVNTSFSSVIFQTMPVLSVAGMHSQDLLNVASMGILKDIRMNIDVRDVMPIEKTAGLDQTLRKMFQKLVATSNIKHKGALLSNVCGGA